MGLLYGYRCPACAYETAASGGRDMGMVAVVHTATCRDCREVAAVLVGARGQDGPTGDAELDRELNVCPDCHGTDLARWTDDLRPCPRCGANMEQAESAPQVLWD
jgi:ssDNA-binding Zn-finger/Zn-ribbon topoisomerase 1